MQTTCTQQSTHVPFQCFCSHLTSPIDSSMGGSSFLDLQPIICASLESWILSPPDLNRQRNVPWPILTGSEPISTLAALPWSLLRRLSHLLPPKACHAQCRSNLGHFSCQKKPVVSSRRQRNAHAHVTLCLESLEYAVTLQTSTAAIHPIKRLDPPPGPLSHPLLPMLPVPLPSTHLQAC